MTVRNKYINLWLPVLLWAGVIFLFSSFPTGTASEIQIGDFIIKKTAHIVEYAIFTLLLFRAFKESGINKKKSAILAILIAIFYGLGDEFHQSFTPGREPKLRDVVFDTIGSVSSIFMLWNFLPKLPPKIVEFAQKNGFV